LRRIGVIDIGTNSILYLLAERDVKENILPVHQEIRTARMGKGMGTQGIVQNEGLANVIHVLTEYEYLAHQQKADHIIAVATHALRAAKNRSEVCRSVHQKTGLDIRVLTEGEEAEASFIGAASTGNASTPSCILDIGGGSTEIILGKAGRIIDFNSVRLGAVGLTERFLQEDPPFPSEWEELGRFITSSLNAPFFSLLARGKQLVGVGGTVTTLAALDLGLKTYDSNRVEGHNLHRTGIQQILDELKRKPVAERQMMISFDPNRADIILAGTCILLAVMDMSAFREILVTDRGLRFGIAIQEFNKIPADGVCQ
jgi:exopolyphosphatase/guanosine-5'-triphosphate,3'-diphosphate pyrophosphatase